MPIPPVDGRREPDLFSTSTGFTFVPLTVIVPVSEMIIVTGVVSLLYQSGCFVSVRWYVPASRPFIVNLPVDDVVTFPSLITVSPVSDFIATR